MNDWNIGDNLNRAIKLAIDSGDAKSVEEAQQLFETYRLAVAVGPDIGYSPTLQASLLTIVNAARRCFLGGVEVCGPTDVKLLVPWLGCRTIAEAIRSLQGSIVRTLTPEIPRVSIGDAASQGDAGEFHVRPTFSGWSGGVIPIDDSGRLDESQEFIPAGVVSGGIAVSEAFQYVRGGNALAGKRSTGISLWRPEQSEQWLEVRDFGPPIEILPSKLWIIGLGHLGQAFLWTLGLMPYARPENVQLVLHDYDTLVPANESTSLLTFPTMSGARKTRAMAKWCEGRGFRTTINERRFNANFKIASDEPRIAFCGVDNPAARAVLEDVGFSQVVEAGLGKGTQEFMAFQMHSFPGPQKARAKWGANAAAEQNQNALLQQPGYRALAEKGMDECGLTMLAGRSVGASFVGAVTSSIVIAELLRMIHGLHRYALLDGNLRSLEYLHAAINDQSLAPFNPGYTAASAQHETTLKGV